MIPFRPVVTGAQLVNDEKSGALHIAADRSDAQQIVAEGRERSRKAYATPWALAKPGRSSNAKDNGRAAMYLN